MNFRKVVFALAVGSLGLTGIASAQVTCTGATASPVFVRVEGTTEAVGDLTLTGCTGTVPQAISINITATAPITNTNVSGQSYTDATATFFGAGTATNGVLNGTTLSFAPSAAGQIGDPAVTGTIVIHGVRVNASQVAVNTSITETPVATGIILTGSAATATSVAYTQQGMGKPGVLGFTNTAICSAGSAVVPLLETEIVSGYAGAFAGENGTPGTYIAVTFGNLATGAKYYAQQTLNGGFAGGGVTAVLVADNTSTTPVSTVTIGPSGSQVTTAAPLTLNGSTATALYWVTGANVAATNVFAVPLYAVTTSGATAGVTSSPTVTAVFMSPSTGYDQFSTNQTPASVSATNNAGTVGGLAYQTLTVGANTYDATHNNGGGQLSSCATTLLFPYILNAGGYDTGIALTNASAGTSVSQDGTCSVMFYGSGAPSANPYVSGTITAGTVGAFTVSTVASGFVGYAIATCNFQNAHGFAFVTDGFGAPGRGLSQGYLAVVTSAAGQSVTAPF